MSTSAFGGLCHDGFEQVGGHRARDADARVGSNGVRATRAPRAHGDASAVGVDGGADGVDGDVVDVDGGEDWRERRRGGVRDDVHEPARCGQGADTDGGVFCAGAGRGGDARARRAHRGRGRGVFWPHAELGAGVLVRWVEVGGV